MKVSHVRSVVRFAEPSLHSLCRGDIDAASPGPERATRSYVTHAYPIVEIVKVLNSLMDLAGITPTELGRAFGLRPYRGHFGAADGAAWRAGARFREGHGVTLDRILIVCGLTASEMRLGADGVEFYRNDELFRRLTFVYVKSEGNDAEHDIRIMVSDTQKSAVVSSG